MNITKEQIKELFDKGNEETKSKLKSDYPDVFKLEVGKWYKTKDGAICYNGGENPNYGFNSDNKGNKFIYDCRWFWDGLWALATEQEVKDALIKEAKKRGFKDGVRVISTDLVDIEVYGSFVHNFERNKLFYGGAIIFDNGKWAEVKEEAKEGCIKPLLDFTFTCEQTEYKKLKGVWTDSVEYKKQLELKEIILNGVTYKQKKKQ